MKILATALFGLLFIPSLASACDPTIELLQLSNRSRSVLRIEDNRRADILLLESRRRNVLRIEDNRRDNITIINRRGILPFRRDVTTIIR